MPALTGASVHGYSVHGSSVSEKVADELHGGDDEKGEGKEGKEGNEDEKDEQDEKDEKDEFIESASVHRMLLSLILQWLIVSPITLRPAASA